MAARGGKGRLRAGRGERGQTAGPGAETGGKGDVRREGDVRRT